MKIPGGHLFLAETIKLLRFLHFSVLSFRGSVSLRKEILMIQDVLEIAILLCELRFL